MRVINLDETGIKLINNKKNQIYIKKDEVSDLVKGNYTIVDDMLHFKNLKLSMSPTEIKDFSVILKYLKIPQAFSTPYYAK